MNEKKGTLYLIPTFLGNADKGLIPPVYLKIIHQLNEFVVENEKPARAFLKAIETPIPLNQITLHPIHKHVESMEILRYLDSCKKGKNIGLLSDAGLPCVADPGYRIVSLAHSKNIHVHPFHGLSSIMLALMASGFNGQEFRFHGYLPYDKNEKKAKVRNMLNDAQRGETQIFIETPYRNISIINALKEWLPSGTKVCIAVDISLPEEQILQLPIGQFPKDLDFLHKRPAVFLIGQ